MVRPNNLPVSCELRPTMLRSSIIRPLVKGWMVPSIRCMSRHHFAPPTFLPSSCDRLSAGKTRYPDIRARGVHKNASSEKQPSDLFTNYYAIEDDGSSLDFMFLVLLFFILGARRRREKREAESVVETSEEVDLDS